MHCRELCEFTEVKAKVTVTPFTRIVTLGPSRSERLQVTRLCGWCLLYEGVDRMRAARLSKQLRFPFGAAPSFANNQYSGIALRKQDIVVGRTETTRYKTCFPPAPQTGRCRVTIHGHISDS